MLLFGHPCPIPRRKAAMSAPSPLRPGERKLEPDEKIEASDFVLRDDGARMRVLETMVGCKTGSVYSGLLTFVRLTK